MFNFEKKFKKIFYYQVLLAVLSGILLFFSFPKFGSKIFVWFSLTPLILSVIFLPQNNIKKVFVLSFVTGIIAYCGVLYWIVPTFVVAGEHWIFGVISVLFLSIYCSIFIFIFCLFLYLYKQVFNKFSVFIIISLSSLWVLLEYLRSVLFSGFPWILLGYSQYDNLPIIQVAECFGVYGISFIIVFVNIFIAVKISDVIVNKTSIGLVMKNVVSIVVLYLLLYFYGINKIKVVEKQIQEKTGNSLSIVLLQGNIDQYKKWDEKYKFEIMQKYSSIVVESYYKIFNKNKNETKKVLFIWPESSVPGWLFEDKVLYDWITNLVKFTNINLCSYHLVGTVRMGKFYNYYYNSAVLLTYEKQILEVKKIYDKIHLVPFGEYVPLRNLLSKFIKTVNDLGEFTKGEKYTVFNLDEQTKFSVLICYESIFPELVAKFVSSGAKFLVNITNDAWFLNTSAPYQHFIFNIFRAVENRCFLFRAANTGISGVISPSGKVLLKTNLFEGGYFVYNTNFYHKNTFYTKFGVYLWSIYFIFFIVPFTKMIKIKNLFSRQDKKLSETEQEYEYVSEDKNISSEPSKTILYVCSGNVFRSVFAEGYTKHLLAKYGVEDVEVKSCGIIAQESFKIPKCMYKFFELYGIKEKDLSTHIPTKINEELLKTANIVLVMDKTHLEFIKENFAEYFSKTFLLKEYAGFFTNSEILDPINQPESVYIKTVEEIKLCIEIIIKNFVKNNKIVEQ